MKILKGEISLNSEEVKLIKDVLDYEAVEEWGTVIQKKVEFEDGKYALLELWITDDEYKNPYLTIFLHDSKDSILIDIDVEVDTDCMDEMFIEYEMILPESKYQVKLVKAKEFDVDMWWYELHGASVKVVANSQEEANAKVKEKFDLYRKTASSYLSDYGDFGVN